MMQMYDFLAVDRSEPIRSVSRLGFLMSRSRAEAIFGNAILEDRLVTMTMQTRSQKPTLVIPPGLHISRPYGLLITVPASGRQA